MEKDDYSLTIKRKIVILQLLFCLVSILCGFILGLYNECKKWDDLIYPSIKIANIDVGGKTKTQAKTLIASEYIVPLMNKKINIEVNNQVYVMDCSKAIEIQDIDKVVEEAFYLGKDKNLFKKVEILKNGIEKNFDISIIYNNEYIENFVKAIESEKSVQKVGVTGDDTG